MNTSQEFLRISQMLAGLTVSVPIALMTANRIGEIEQRAAGEPTLASLNNELRQRLRAVQRPLDHQQMAQAYEVYSEASFWLEMADRGVRLDRRRERVSRTRGDPILCTAIRLGTSISK
jgi:hypothetical protein